MLLSSILTACIRNGVTVTQPSPDRRGNPYYVLRKGDKVLEFYTNSDSDYVGNMTYRHPETNSMVDLFMDSYFHTIKHAMQFLNPSGELVRPTRNIPEKIADPVNPDDVPNDVQVSKNEEKGGIEIRFENKPSQDIINTLKNDRHFNWSPFHKVWWKKFNIEDYQWAQNTFNVCYN